MQQVASDFLSGSGCVPSFFRCKQYSQNPALEPVCIKHSKPLELALFSWYFFFMFIYLLCAIPAVSLLLHQSVPDKTSRAARRGIFYLGLVLSFLYTLVSVFLFSSYRLAPEDFYSNWFFCFSMETAIPLALCFVFFAVFGRGSLSFKLDNAVAYILGFYAIFLPFRIISMNKSYDAFLLFWYPSLIVAMILLIRFACLFIRLLNPSRTSLKVVSIILTVFAVLIALIMPSLIWTMYFLCIKPGLYLALSIVTLVLAVAGNGVVQFFVIKNHE